MKDRILCIVLKIMLFAVFGVFSSCTGNNTDNEINEKDIEKEASQVIYTLGMTSDSLRSPEQKAFASKMEMIVYERCVIKNKRFELNISKREFKTIGLPEIYYDLLKRDIEDMNRCLDGTIIIADFIPDSIINAFNKSRDEYFTAKE
jgi:hypothetical protein